MNMGIQISLKDSAFSSFTYIPIYPELELYGDSVFNFFRRPHSVFHSSYFLFTFSPAVHRVPISPPTHQHLFSGGLVWFGLGFFGFFFFFFSGGGHPNGYEVVFYFCFSFHFINN